MAVEKMKEGTPAISGGVPHSRQVSWFETFAYAERFASSRHIGLDGLPLPGTPAWCGMPDADAHKLLALILGGVREALGHDARQEQLAQASHDVAEAVDTQSIACGVLRQEWRRNSNVYIPREVA